MANSLTGAEQVFKMLFIRTKTSLQIGKIRSGAEALAGTLVSWMYIFIAAVSIAVNWPGDIITDIVFLGSIYNDVLEKEFN